MNQIEPLTADTTIEEAYEMLSTQAVRSILAAIPAALYITDTQGRILQFNEFAAALWGRRPEAGELWCGSWKILNDDGSVMPLDQCPMALTVKSGEPTLGRQITVERPDGKRAVVAPHPWPIRDDEGTIIGAVNLLVDVTHPREIESALRLAELDAKRLSSEVVHQRRLTQLLAESHNLDEVAETMLRILCQLSSAQVGCLWIIDGRATLHSVATFSPNEATYEEFCKASVHTTIKLDENLPGKVIRDRQLIWVKNLSAVAGFKRRMAAQVSGLASAVAVPVNLRDELPVRAVIELFFAEPRARDERLIKSLEEASIKLGVFLDRLEVENASAEDERRLLIAV